MYADNPELFNRHILDACQVADETTSRLAIQSSDNTESDMENDLPDRTLPEPNDT